MKTLIVEDDKTSGKLLQAVLESEGFETALADDGQKALDLLKANKFDCIVSDVMMPNVDGYRLAYKVRQHENYRDIPFIMYTSSYASHDDEQFAVSLGVNKYIRKPGTAKDIVKAIRELIESRTHKDTLDLRTNRDQWMMEKYGKLLIDKLEGKVDELEKAKRELEWSEKKLRESNEIMKWQAEKRTKELQTVEKRTAELSEELKNEKNLVEMKSKFISIASHEFRTPLSTISIATGMIRKFQDSLSPEEISRKLQDIEKQVEHMTFLLDDVLVIEKTCAGKIKIQQKEININEFFENLCHEIENIGDSSHLIRLQVNASANRILSDEKSLRSIFINLLTNAIKFSPSSQYVDVTVNSDHASLLVSVKDYGIGIPADDVENLFEPFFRGGNVSTIEGTGLGLSIIRKTLDLLKGTINVNSVPNKGTEMIINLPIAERESN